MEVRAGTDIREEARNDRIEFKLKLRKKMLTEKLMKRIVPPSPPTAQTSLSKASSDAEVKEKPNLNKEAPEEIKGKLDLNICRKKKQNLQKEMLGMCFSISLQEKLPIHLLLLLQPTRPHKKVLLQKKNRLYIQLAMGNVH